MFQLILMLNILGFFKVLQYLITVFMPNILGFLNFYN